MKIILKNKNKKKTDMFHFISFWDMNKSEQRDPPKWAIHLNWFVQINFNEYTFPNDIKYKLCVIMKVYGNDYDYDHGYFIA